MCDPGTSDDFDLTILPCKKDEKKSRLRRPIHPLLPDANAGACVILCAGVRAGKSNYGLNLLMNSNMYKDAFSDVYIFSSTINQDETMKKLREAYPSTSYDHYSDARLQKILTYQQSFPADEMPPIAIYIDDVLNIKPKSLFFTISCSFRHYGISLLVYSVQALKLLSPCVRTCATNVFIGTNSGQQLKNCAVEWGEHVGGEDQFLQLHKKCVQKRFEFMYMRLDKYPCAVHRNFDLDPVYEDDV